MHIESCVFAPVPVNCIEVKLLQCSGGGRCTPGRIRGKGTAFFARAISIMNSLGAGCENAPFTFACREAAGTCHCLAASALLHSRCKYRAALIQHLNSKAQIINVDLGFSCVLLIDGSI